MSSLMNAAHSNAVLTMTSREIADIVHKRHDNVKRTVETLVARGAIESPQIEEIKTTTRTGSIYRICKRDTYVVVAQLSPEFTARLVDRWQELEVQVSQSAPALPNFSDPVEAARAWANEVEQSRVLMVEQQQLRSRNDHLENLFKDGVGVVDFARQLNGVNINQIQNFLIKKGWFTRTTLGVKTRYKARDTLAADRISHFTHPVTEEPCERSKPVLLKRGAQALYKMYLNDELPMKNTWNGSYTQELMQ